MADKPSEKIIDTKDVHVEIESSMVLDNIINRQFDEDFFQEGLDFISRYCAMFVGLRNTGMEEDKCVEIIKEIIKEHY